MVSTATRTIPTLVLRGTHYEMGRQHGKAYASVIADIAANNLRSVVELARTRAGYDLTPSMIFDALQRYVPYVQEHVPHLYDETRGIADGAGIAFDEVFALNAFLDLFDLTFRDSADKILYSGGCTVFGVTGPADSWAYMGQNYDVRSLFQPGVFLMDLRPPDAPRALVQTIAGMVGCSGLNERGLGVAINNLTPRDSRPGVPHQYVLRHALAQQRIGDAVNAITSLPRASGFNYLVGDASGELVGLETSATRYAVYFAEPQGYTCHCNHYVTPHLLDEEGTPKTNGDSIIRYGRTRHRLLRLAPDSALAGLQALCADHTNYPYSICRHTPPEQPATWNQGTTVFSVVYDLRRTRLYMTNGNPCCSQYETFGFEEDEDEN